MDHTPARRQRQHGPTGRLAAVGLSALLACVAGAMPTLAQTAIQTAFMGMESERGAPQSFADGVLTADPAREIEIDHVRFALHAEAMVMDNEGRVRRLQDLREGATVKFHVQQRTIDVLIWVLPQ